MSPFEKAHDKIAEAIRILDEEANTPETRQAYIRLQEGRMWLLQQIEQDRTAADRSANKRPAR